MINNEILVIPDVHAEPGVSTEHLVWASKLALKRQPQTIIFLGDFADMGSLCSYDKGSVAAEGRRLVDDIEACKDAVNDFMAPIWEYNAHKTKNAYKPLIVLTEGNHEYRLRRYGQVNPEFHGHTCIDLLGYKDAGWKVIPFNKPYRSNGILFQHHFSSGVMGKAIGCKYHAGALLRVNMESSVCAHSHLFDMHVQTSGSGKRMIGLVAGCYFRHNHEWTGENQRYWRGLVYLRDVKAGSFWPELLSMDYLERRFG